MTTRKRSGSGSKRQLKEKVVQIYELFFKGDDLSKNNPTFWDEFFLLKPKVSYLENEIMKLTPDQLTSLRGNLNLLFSQCIETLSHEHNIRVVYSMQTLCALVSSIYKKVTAESGFDVIHLLMGFQSAEEKMQQLLHHCHVFLTSKLNQKLIFSRVKIFILTTFNGIEFKILYMVCYHVFQWYKNCRFK